jgi:dihydroflavonol-4-reductase
LGHFGSVLRGINQLKKMNKINFVTGGTGFLGAHLMRHLLSKGETIRAIKRSTSPMDLVKDIADKIEWVEGDITDIVALEEAMEGVTHVYHCAAVVSFHPKDLQKMMKINVEGTANVVNLCLDKKIEKLVHVSSIAALGRTKERPHLDETAKWVQSKLNTNYGISKYLAEQEVWRGKEEGLNVAIVNPSIIMGLGFWDLGSAKFYTQVNDGLKFCPIGCSGFVDVHDVVRFMVLLMESNISGQRYVLNSDNLTYKAFFGKIAQSIGKKPPFIPVSRFLAETAWRVEWLKEKILGATPMVTRESALTSITSFTYANEKSKGVFGFEYLDLDETLTKMGKAFLKDKNH